MPSLSETWLTSAASPGATAKPWFWAVTSTRLEPRDADGVVGAAVAERQLERLAGRARARASWWPRQMPKSGTCPSSSRTVSIGPSSCAGSPGPLPISTARRVELEDASASQVAGHDDRLEPRLGEPAHDRALAAEVEDDDARAGADRERLGHARVERGRRRRELGLREHARPVEVRLRERARVQLLGRRRRRARSASRRPRGGGGRARACRPPRARRRRVARARPPRRAARAASRRPRSRPRSTPAAPRRRRSCRRAGRRSESTWRA